MISSASILYLLAMSGIGVFLGLTGWTAYVQLRARNRYNAYISRMPKAVEYADIDRLVREKRSEWEDLMHRAADAGELVRKKEEAARWLLDNAALTERIAADREIHAKLAEDLDALKKEIAAQQQLHGRYKLAVLELEAKIKQLEVKEKEAAAQVASAKADANQQALELRQKLEVAKEQTRLQEEALLQRIRSFEERESELNSRVNVAQQACAAAEERLRSKQSELDALASLVAERTAAAREAQQAFVADLERQVQERRTLLETAIDELKKYRDGVEKGLVEKQGELQQESLRLDSTRSEFARLRGEADAEQVRLDGLRVDVARELSKTPVIDGDEEQTADLWNGGLVSPSRVERRAQNQEAAELDKVAAHFEGMGLRFHRRTLDAFHTSLKVADISPLVVLAGISGTGKSELPRRYAEAMQMHYLCLPVQPRWDSPQDMFGFFNYLEHRYRATPLSRALVQMDPFHAEADRGWSTPDAWESRHDQMLLVLLDEMNLARVEYYFSEFLSRLETRRSVNKLNPESRKDAEIILETGLKGGSSMRLFVDNNVLFVGTMNEDESTQTLSDKVIDRSNVLRFGRPSRLDSKRPKPNEIENNHTTQPRLAHKSWRSWIRDDDVNASWSSEVDGWLKRVNDALTIVHRPFGYRAHQSIRTYVANYPEVERAERWKLAFVDQIEQKILPKFRGVDVSDGKSAQAIRNIKELIGELGDEALRKAVEAANRDHQFAWTGFDRPESEGR